MLRLLVWPLFALVMMMLPAAPTGARAPERIVAVGDLHGDYDAWLAIARGAGLVDQRGRWTGGATTLVQLGDVVDRGPDSLKIIRHLKRLQRESRRRGGQVIVLVGNHEAMMMTGDMRYVHPGEYAAFADRNSAALRDRVYEASRASVEADAIARDPTLRPADVRAAWMKEVPLGRLEYQAAWRSDGELGEWVLGNPAVVKLGDSLFVHGGISSRYADQSIAQINEQVAAALKSRDSSAAAIINDPTGPLWYRGLVTRGTSDETTLAPSVPGATPLTPDQEVALALQKFGVSRIVVGHTPSTQIIEALDGRLWRIDSGNSRTYGGVPSWLEIRGSGAVARQAARTTSNAFPEGQ
ncbi:metallophosphoesterase [Sphingomonas xanthus]|uniref:Protein-tyrosine-phosphatase n=1 Tax=Sphingomonas xanthus TaxID=2594473 RepID=A0A516IQ06_9SPHN|nr:metallophosphoesterase [Sphingomonas xanthus]QDP18991.1 protein-tyrosine-phosphatase [Sphingomonas xanthus]